MSKNTSHRTDRKADDRDAADARRGTGHVDGVQGEGDYESARRYQEDTERFIEEGKVDGAAKRARPRNAEEQQAMEKAEETGRRRSQGEDAHDGFARRETRRDRHH